MQYRHDAIMDLWKQRNYLNFKVVEFDRFKNEAEYNYFTMNPQVIA